MSYAFSTPSKHYFIYLVFLFRLFTVQHGDLFMKCSESFNLEKSYFNAKDIEEAQLKSERNKIEKCKQI